MNKHKEINPKFMEHTVEAVVDGHLIKSITYKGVLKHEEKSWTNSVGEKCEIRITTVNLWK